MSASKNAWKDQVRSLGYRKTPAASRPYLPPFPSMDLIPQHLVLSLQLLSPHVLDAVPQKQSLRLG